MEVKIPVLEITIICISLTYGCSRADVLPSFVGCETNEDCTITSENRGTVECEAFFVDQDSRLMMTTSKDFMNIHYQRESIVTMDRVTNISLLSNYTVKSPGCGRPIKVVCTLTSYQNTKSSISSTKTDLAIVNPCEPSITLTIESKVLLAAITIFPFLWVFALVSTIYMNRKTLPTFLRRNLRSDHVSREYRSLRPRRLTDLNKENHKNELYVYFVDEKCCFAISTAKPKRSIQLILETLIPPGKQFVPADSESCIEMRNYRRKLDYGEETRAIKDQTYSINTSVDNVEQLTLSEDFTILNETNLPEAAENSVSDSENKVLSTLNQFDKEDEVLLMQREPEWCRCGCCQEAASHLEELCCIRSYGACVTKDRLFEQLVTDANTIQAAITQWYSPKYEFAKTRSSGCSNSDFRRACYNEYIHWQLGEGQRIDRVIVPSCVVKAVRAKYPSDDYTGFIIPNK